MVQNQQQTLYNERSPPEEIYYGFLIWKNDKF